MITYDLVADLVKDQALRVMVYGLLMAFAFGLLIRPYQSLPERVESLESTSKTLELRLLQQERKLDLVVCFLETEASGGNPLACSR